MSIHAEAAHMGKIRDAVPGFSAMHSPKFPWLILLEPKSPFHGIHLEKTSARTHALLAFKEIDF
jgi:hypothetical protein